MPNPGALRHSITDVADILNQSVARTWVQIREGKLRAQRDGRRTYVSDAEIRRYVVALDELANANNAVA